MSNKLIYFGIAAMAGLFATSVAAVQLKPGKWEITSEVQNPMMPQPQVQTQVECMDDTEFDPTKDLAADAGCTISDKQESKSSISWSMQCNSGDAATMKGKGKFQTNGDTAAGEMQMKMAFNGQQLSMTTHWQGKRLGACD